jgi:hypothetical protein
MLIIAIPSEQPTQPPPDDWNWRVPALMQLNLFERYPYTLADSDPLHLEHAALGSVTEMRESEKIESPRRPLPMISAIFSRIPTKAQKACFLWM